MSVMMEIKVPFPYKEKEQGNCTIFELTRTRCHWPLGLTNARPPYLYCGSKTDGGPYCHVHKKLAFNQPRPLQPRNKSY